MVELRAGSGCRFTFFTAASYAITWRGEKMNEPVKICLVSNAEIDSYLSDDGYGKPLNMLRGEVVLVSKVKAEQMLRDFPQYFKIMDDDDKVAASEAPGDIVDEFEKITASPRDKMIKPTRIGKKQRGVK